MQPTAQGYWVLPQNMPPIRQLPAARVLQAIFVPQGPSGGQVCVSVAQAQ